METEKNKKPAEMYRYIRTHGFRWRTKEENEGERERESRKRGVSAIIFIGIFSHLTSNVYFLIILLLGEIMFGLDTLGEWEDLILYKNENKAVVERSVWSDKLCPGGSGESSLMRLTDIRHVGVSTTMGLFILQRNGKIIALNMKGLTRKEVQDLRKEISHFLNMSRLKYLDHSLVDPSDRLLLPSDSEEYLQHLPRSCLSMSNEFTASDNVLGGTLGRTCCQVQENLSYPSLMHGTQLNSYQVANLRRSPYTENSTRFNYVKHTRNTSAISTSRDLPKPRKECI
ncbi:PREDICTED: uncharacterized protein LOC105559293 isoform X2 [Vollenhovia emeryi]|uniref:uncharacterized protein LOC105559293 isoform X2 n=1 Tax=Vollenhovia emeryi TaxID=411798 RepID=UPI0005F401F1|nr:PREDICTED: uncharacterized protein LOC105559293 isoform X2 [Vollenhovia emeryi]